MDLQSSISTIPSDRPYRRKGRPPKEKIVEVTLPKQLWFLLGVNKRYKVAHGGRGCAKSTSFVKALIVKACSLRHRILCIREIQRSIKESVYQLIRDQIEKLGVLDKFEFTNTEIKHRLNGSQFIFLGMRTDPDKVKSLEGVDICYVEEADQLSDESWELLIPTIRKPGSEIWIVFNDKSEEDPVYKRFILNPPEDCISVKMTYLDIPKEWLSPEIDKEIVYCKNTDPAAYRRIWLGEPIGAGGYRIWAPFNENVHIKEYHANDLMGYKAFMAMDPHSKYFPFCVWVARRQVDVNTNTYEYYIYNEWPRWEMYKMFYHELRGKKLFAEWGGLHDLAEQIRCNDWEHLGLKVEARFIDTRFAKGAGGESWSTSTVGIIAELAAVNLHFRMPSERIIDIQRERILDLLRYNTKQPITEFNRPLLAVAPWCHNVIMAFKHHKTEANSEREHDKYKDASDALRICFAGMSTIMDVPKENSIVSSKKYGFYGLGACADIYTYATEGWMA